MRYRFSLWLFLALGSISILLLSGCNREDENLARERREMEAFNQHLTTDIYRCLKLSLRSLPMEEELDATNLSAKEREKRIRNQKRELPAVKLYSLAFHILQAKTAGPEEEPGVLDYLIMAKEVVELRKMLNTLDEDEFPTILDNFALLGASVTGGDPKRPFHWYNNDTEHLLLGTIWMSYPGVPEELGVYEMTQLEPEKIIVPQMRLLAHALRSGFFYKQEWHYHAELEATHYLEMLDRNRKTLTAYFDSALIPGTTVENEEQAYAQLHALGVALRGFIRMKIEKQNKALSDFQDFLTDAKVIGLDDEGVWLIGAYVAIQNGQWSEASTLLNKLAESEQFSKKEIQQIEALDKQVLVGSADESATETLVKTLAMHIVVGYLEETLLNAKWQQEIRNTEVGDAFIGGMETLDQEIEAITANFDGDQLTQEAKEFTEEATEKVGGLMKDLWEGAGELLDSTLAGEDSTGD